MDDFIFMTKLPEAVNIQEWVYSCSYGKYNNQYTII